MLLAISRRTYGNVHTVKTYLTSFHPTGLELGEQRMCEAREPTDGERLELLDSRILCSD